MPNHKNPTKEELKKIQEDALNADPNEKNEDEEDESEAPKEEDQDEDDSEGTSGEDAEDKEEDEESDAEDADDESEEDQDEEEVEDKKAPEDQADPSKELFKKKASASARENQKIYAKNRVINQAIIDADEIPAPTDEEMGKIYGEDWDLATNLEKESLRETQITRAWRAKIKEASDQATKIEKWGETVEEWTDDPKNLNEYPQIDGKEEEFKDFAMQPDNNSVPLPILVKAFSFEQGKNKVQHKSEMFPRGKGGSKEKVKPKDGKITLEEARVLRETDYPKYKEMLATKKIDYNI